MQLVVTINLDNAAFQSQANDWENVYLESAICTVLEQAGDKVSSLLQFDKTDTRLRLLFDVNGNNCGTIRLEGVS